MTATAESGEFKRGWPVVLSSAVGIGLGLSPLPLYSLSVLLKPLSQEFGWKDSQINAGLLVMTLTVLVAGPIVGYLADRFGARPVALISILLFSLSFASFGFMSGDLTQFYILWAVMGVAGAGTLPITFTRGVNSWFVANRGLALGLALIATGLGGLAAIRLGHFLVEGYGWRAAYFGIAAMPLLISLPLALFMFRERPNADRSAAQRVLYGMSLGAAFMHWRFWVLAFAFVPISLALGGVVPNMVKILLSEGFSESDSVNLNSLIPITVMLGRIAGGLLIDRIWAPGLAFVLLALPTIGLMELATVGTPSFWFATGAVVMIGFALGVEYDFMAFMTARYFGMKYYASVYGALYAFFALGAGMGPLYYSILFEMDKSYGPALFYGGLMTMIGAGILPLLGRYPEFSDAHPSGRET